MTVGWATPEETAVSGSFRPWPVTVAVMRLPFGINPAWWALIKPAI